ncbi:uncharacterized protein LOC128953540 [Oppia nitens]|uniref:uncharacterized protein LOC128953540 n=1 Tax=Oppia nitens TaxID=1686743 RepID=UPI0023DB73BD|nr:uncharacterized protein LOC128953540 [Oppia nitens]
MGYDLTRFEGPVDDELICSICDGVLQKPTQVVTCEHVFCGQCLDDWLREGKQTCPLDREFIARENGMKSPRIVTNLLAKLNIKCDFESYGCRVVVKLESLGKHSGQCPYNPEKPLRCEKGCGQVLANRTEFDEHNCMEKLHNLVRDQSDQLDGQQQQIDELKAELLTYRNNYQKLDDEFRQTRHSINSIEFKLAVEQTKSAKLLDCMSKCAHEMTTCHSLFKEHSSASQQQIRRLKSVSVRYNGTAIDVDPYERLGKVKTNLMKILNIRSGKLKLFNGPDELDNDMKSLIDYGIQDIIAADPMSTTTRLSMVQCDEIQVFVKIRVMNSRDNIRHPYLSSDFLPKTVALRCDRKGSIGQLKTEIRLIHHSIDSEDVLLTYGTVTLEDQFDLSYYNITDGSFINYYAHL